MASREIYATATFHLPGKPQLQAVHTALRDFPLVVREGLEAALIQRRYSWRMTQVPLSSAADRYRPARVTDLIKSNPHGDLTDIFGEGSGQVICRVRVAGTWVHNDVDIHVRGGYTDGICDKCFLRSSTRLYWSSHRRRRSGLRIEPRS